MTLFVPEVDLTDVGLAAFLRDLDAAVAADGVDADDEVEAAKALVRGEKFNPNHEPAGSPEGGQFTTGAGGGGGARPAPEDTPGTWQWFESRESQLFSKHPERALKSVHEHWSKTYAGCDEIQDAAERIAAGGTLDSDDDWGKFVETGAAVLMADVNRGDDGVWMRGLNGIGPDAFTVGQEVDIPLASATYDKNVAWKYAHTPVAKRGALIGDDDAEPLEKRGRVILELHGKGSAQVWQRDMREVIVSGRYRVREIVPAGTFTDRGVLDGKGVLVPGSQRTFEKVEEPRRIVLEQVGQFAVPAVSSDALRAAYLNRYGFVK